MSEKSLLLEESKDLISLKVSKMEEFYNLSLKQTNILKSVDFDRIEEEEYLSGDDTIERVDELLDEKSEIITIVNSLDSEFVNTFEDLKKSLPGGKLDSIVETDEFKSLQESIAKVFELVGKIQENEKNNQKIMDMLYGSIMKGIRKVNDSNSTNKYTNRPISDLDKGFFVDQRK